MSALPPVKKFVSNTGMRIYRIACRVFETLSARVYLLLGAGPPTLLDAGSGVGSSTSDILAGLAAVRAEFGEPIGVSDIRRIIISHGHTDHIGGLPDLVQQTHAEVAVNALDRMAVEANREHVVLANHRLSDFFERAGVSPGRRNELLGVFHLHGRRIEGVEIGLTLTDGQEIDGLRIIHTPGHSPGHVCIAIGDILLSGDHILSQTVPQQWPESTAPYTGLGHYLESLEKIDRLSNVRLTLAAHEQTIHDLHARIDTIRRAHQRRLDRLLSVLADIDRPLTLSEIAHHLYPEATGFRGVLAITDVGSRVEYLHQRGQLRVCNLDDVERDEDAVYRYCVV